MRYFDFCLIHVLPFISQTFRLFFAWLPFFSCLLDMDPSPPSFSEVEGDSQPSFPDPMNKLADLTSDCQISSDGDPLQRAMSAMSQTFGSSDMDDDGDGNMESGQMGSSEDTMDEEQEEADSNDAAHQREEAEFSSAGACGGTDGSSSSDAHDVFPANQRAYAWHEARRHLWLDNNPIAVEKANKTASALADSAEKIRDGFVGHGMEKHDFPEVDDESIDFEVAPYEVTGPFRITIPELILHTRSEFNRTFAVYGTTLEFVITKRRSEDFPWYIPPLSDFTEVVNQVQVRILERGFRFLDVLVETSSWCGVGVIALKATCPLRMQRWREQLTRVDLLGYEYNSFPKDALITRDIQVSILLRSGLKNFKLKWIAHELKIRNPLKGRMTIVYSKTYGPGDKTRAGISKNGWRLVIAKVDAVFAESLKLLPFGYGFRVGASTVQIRFLSSTGEPALPQLGMAPEVQPLQPSHHNSLRVQVHDQLRTQSAQFRQQQFKQVDPQAGPIAASREIPQSEVPLSKLPSLTFPMVPELVKSITVPLPLSQVKPKFGPGSRGGKKAKNIAAAAASAVAKKAFESIYKKVN